MHRGHLQVLQALLTSTPAEHWSFSAPSLARTLLGNPAIHVISLSIISVDPPLQVTGQVDAAKRDRLRRVMEIRARNGEMRRP